MQICITNDNDQEMACTIAVVVPDNALEEPGRIRSLAADAGSHRKHDFHALVQMALVQFEDHELVPITITEKIRVTAGEEFLEIQNGAVIGVRETGRIVLISNSGQPLRKLLVAAHRFCTRSIRLDLLK